ncbi:MAG: aldehyde dehydrogenase family protein [Methanomassiliicoccaceae archaeon]|nr:aldehyde dehydrogenase family protein [Methanomassiliicoccaceae archaeon]
MKDARSPENASGNVSENASDNADKKFDGALNSILHTDKRDYPCYVGGLKVASGIEHIVRSPVDGSIIFGRFQEAEDGLPDVAAGVAANAFRIWSKTDPVKRAELFETILNGIKKQKYRIAASITLSAGMTRNDSLYEADRLAEVIGTGIKEIRDSVKGKPAGVWAVISEYNSPLAAPMGYAAAAMLAGNTVIVIPPKECPFPVYLVYEIMAAVLPDGVLNLLYDRKGKAMRALAESEHIAGIAAIGRGDGFEDIMFSAAGDDLMFMNEFKGMNPLFVHRPASMQAAAEIAIASAFGHSGQRTDSCSKVIVTAAEQRSFIDQLLSAAKKITVGDPAEKDTFMGPVISEENMERFMNIVKEHKDNLIFGGKRVMNDVTNAGNYVMPAIFAGLPDDNELNTMDHSLPILSVHIVNDEEEAAEAANGCEFGHGMGIVSKDENIVERFVAGACSDIVYVNGPSSIVGVAINADISQFMRK